MNHSSLITVILAAVKKASKGILRDFHELRFLQSSRRPLDRFLGYTISKAEGIIFEELQKARPEFGVVSKHSSSKASNQERCWVVNVLEGIENFARAIPCFAITIAVVQREEVIAGVICVPVLGEVYFAEKGKGAWCEFSDDVRFGTSENRVRVSERKPVRPLVFTNDVSLKKTGCEVRVLGSSAISLAYIAAGRGDGCVVSYDDFSDVAAGVVLAQEAGAIVEHDEKEKRVVVKGLGGAGAGV